MIRPLDTHAHIKPDIAAHELSDLNAYVIAVTRTPEEYALVRQRGDETIAWGLGCHPGLAKPSRTFDAGLFGRLLAEVAVVGEVGLDGSSRVPMDVQIANLTAILRLLQATPVVASVHSAGATGPLMDLLEQHHSPGVILHWWRGTREETARGVELGCYFSVNSRDLRQPAVMGIVPPERILTETDHPAGDRGEPTPRRPGHMPKITAALARAWGVTSDDVTRQVWRNWRKLALSTHSADRLPPAFQRELLGAY